MVFLGGRIVEKIEHLIIQGNPFFITDILAEVIPNSKRGNEKFLQKTSQRINKILDFYGSLGLIEYHPEKENYSIKNQDIFNSNYKILDACFLNPRSKPYFNHTIYSDGD